VVTLTVEARVVVAVAAVTGTAVVVTAAASIRAA
jgi:hypothetical protein